jgi:glutaredoxin
MRRFAIAVAAMLVAATASAQMYRWVDKDGKVYYTDTPPPAAAKNVQKRATAPAAAAAGDAGPAAPYAIQQAAKNFPVVVYTAPNCGQPCADGKVLLAARGVPYREIAVGPDSGMSTEELKKATGGDTVPVMMVGRSTTRGFEPEMWHSALDAGGYPRGAPPLSAQAQKAAAAPAAKADAPKAEPAPAEPEKPKGPYAPK